MPSDLSFKVKFSYVTRAMSNAVDLELFCVQIGRYPVWLPTTWSWRKIVRGTNKPAGYAPCVRSAHQDVATPLHV